VFSQVHNRKLHGQYFVFSFDVEVEFLTIMYQLYVLDSF